MVQKAVKTGVIHTETVTKSGECKVEINIQLDINLNGDVITAKAVAKPSKPIEEESVNWAIPDFTSTPKLNFGKETK